MAHPELNPGAAPANSKSRVVLLITLLNLILMAGLLYKTFSKPITASGGVMLALYNDLPITMNDVTFEYPGGSFKFPSLGAHGGQVGTPLNYGSDFVATLGYTDEEGKSHKEKFRVRPQGDFLILVYVEPVLEETVVKTADGKEETVLKASPDKVRIISVLQAPDSNI